MEARGDCLRSLLVHVARLQPDRIVIERSSPEQEREDLPTIINAGQHLPAPALWAYGHGAPELEPLLLLADIAASMPAEYHWAEVVVITTSI